MSQNPALVNLTFGLSQLSGNQGLLNKLLSAFYDEYSGLAAELNELMGDKDWTRAKQRVHTVKGVAGNLGLDALHVASKDFETALKDGVDDGNQQAFFSVLAATLSAIQAQLDATMTTPSPSPTQPSNEQPGADANTVRQDLKTALQRNEFIPAQELQQRLAATDLDTETQSKVAAAVDDLDYATAIALL
ncbi:Hpt domain-containing protein [Aestuariibacter halophilus]|uniref:Hpt domain-containing protein n=1 Tax=Fluctibacter halophilus TaxID=226011 RepID=A0ABS8G835_9ALTE|nr:Hpt domain-containing protein [Aestuariibacter halophilus]MCC2616732.1 Hpt domain-containing protein [Aestuariibacter halophilus]